MTTMTSVLPDIDLSALEDLDFEPCCDTWRPAIDKRCENVAEFSAVYKCAFCGLTRDRLQCFPCLTITITGERICWNCEAQLRPHWLIGAPIRLRG